MITTSLGLFPGYDLGNNRFFSPSGRALIDAYLLDPAAISRAGRSRFEQVMRKFIVMIYAMSLSGKSFSTHRFTRPAQKNQISSITEGMLGVSMPKRTDKNAAVVKRLQARSNMHYVLSKARVCVPSAWNVAC